MSVYKAINAVQRSLAAEGISKARKNQQQGYNFRGIDDIYNAVSSLLANNGLCILPRVLSRDCVERQSAKGGALFYVTCEVEFDFVCSEDGSKHTVKTYGEAMDSADKATNKAMSAAYKYAVMQAFAIPTEGDNDADATTHDVRPRASQRQQWLDDTTLKLEDCNTPDELKAVWSAAVATTKAEHDTAAYETLKPVMERMAAHIKANAAKEPA
jgi:hypothetical protein